MNFEQARDEMKRLANGEYHKLSYRDVDADAPGDSSGVEFSVYIHHLDPDSSHGYSKVSWEDAIEKFKEQNPWCETKPVLVANIGKSPEHVGITLVGPEGRPRKEELGG